MLYGQWNKYVSPSPFVGVFAGPHLTSQSVLYCLRYAPGISAIAATCVELRTDGGPIKGTGAIYAHFPYVIELRDMDVRHFVNEECSHLPNGWITKCGCSGLILFCYISCMGAMICDINNIGFVSVYTRTCCDALVASYATVQ